MNDESTFGNSPHEKTDDPWESSLTPFEAAWSRLVPSASGIDHDVLMFRAGQASLARRKWSSWSWPIAFGSMSALCAVLLGMLLVRHEPDAVEPARTVHVPPRETHPPRDRPQPSESTPPTLARRVPDVRSRAAYLMAVDRLLVAGADPWERHAPARSEIARPVAKPVPYRERLKTLLPPATSPAGDGSAPNRSGAPS